MVETRGGSSTSKRSSSSSSSSSSSAKRPKVAKDSLSRSLPSAEIIGPVNEPENESRETELSPSNPPDTDASKGMEVCDATLSEQSPAMAVIEGEVLSSPQPLGETAVDGEKSKVVGSAADGRSKKRSVESTKTSPKAAWGRLISQCSQNQHLSLCSSQFTVGHGRQCNLWLNDPAVSNVLCKLKLIKLGDSSVPLLEITGDKGAVQVNGRNLKKNYCLILNAGDEVVFSSDKNAYVSFYIRFGCCFGMKFGPVWYKMEARKVQGEVKGMGNWIQNMLGMLVGEKESCYLVHLLCTIGKGKDEKKA